MFSPSLNSFPRLRFARAGGWLCLVSLSLPAQPVASPYLFTHLAGPAGGFGDADGIGAAASFNGPNGVAVDGAGTVYVADMRNHAIRKVTPGGTVTTLYRSGESAYVPIIPVGLAVDGAGTVFVADLGAQTLVIRKITAGGAISTLATIASLYDGGIGLAVDRAGTVYFSSPFYHTIGQVTPDGAVSTLAGSKDLFGSTDGTGADARFHFPEGLAVDNAGNVYVADSGNSTIRLITPAGVVTTLAGSAGQPGSTDGLGLAARFDRPYGVTIDGGGTLYVTEIAQNLVRRIAPGGAVSTLAGTAGVSGPADGTGANAQFTSLRGVAVDNAGTLFVADHNNNALRRITAAGVVTTLAGAAGGAGMADGIGPTARFSTPRGAAVDSSGNLYVTDTSNHTIRKITPGGVVTTLAGIAGMYSGSADGTGPAAQFAETNGVAVDSSGNVYVADTYNHTIRRITPGGVVTTLAGTAGQAGSTDGTGAAARFAYPRDLAVDRTGNLYVADSLNCTIRKISPGGTVTTLAGSAGQGGSVDGMGPAARFDHPVGVDVDRTGNLYVADQGNFTGSDTGGGVIRKITSDGTVTTLAGSSQRRGDTDGIGVAARFDRLNGLAVDRAGNVFVTEARGTLRKITPGGEVTTVAGGNVQGHADGIGLVAQFNNPTGLAIDDADNLYVADSFNNAIRKGVLAGPPVISAQPQNQTAAAGGGVQFSVTASGVPDPTYQWYFNGNAFSGGTGSTLSFTSARSTDAGDYTVVVTNSIGSVTSAKATLTVNAVSTPPPSSGGASSGGGGGAPSLGFIVALAALAGIRHGCRRAHTSA